MESATFAYVGCYTTRERDGHGEGVGVYRIRPDSLEWTRLQLVTDLVHPSFLTLDRRARFLYAAHGDASHASAFSIDVAFHPTLPYAYVINELASTITTYQVEAAQERLLPLGDVSTLPPTFTGDNTTAATAVSPSGRVIFGSNRGHDSIVILAVDAASGALTPVGWEPVCGRTPRFFAFDPSGNMLCVANQDSDAIVPFQVSRETGALCQSDQVVQTGSPALWGLRAPRDSRPIGSSSNAKAKEAGMICGGRGIDCHTHLGDFKAVKNGVRCWTAEDLVASMDRTGVDVSVVCHLISPLSDATDFRPANDLVLEAMRRQPDRLVVVRVANPGWASPQSQRRGADWPQACEALESTRFSTVTSTSTVQ